MKPPCPCHSRSRKSGHGRGAWNRLSTSARLLWPAVPADRLCISRSLLAQQGDRLTLEFSGAASGARPSSCALSASAATIGSRKPLRGPSSAPLSPKPCLGKEGVVDLLPIGHHKDNGNYDRERDEKGNDLASYSHVQHCHAGADPSHVRSEPRWISAKNSERTIRFFFETRSTAGGNLGA